MPDVNPVLSQEEPETPAVNVVICPWGYEHDSPLMDLRLPHYHMEESPDA